MDERAIGGAGGDVGERVRGVRGIDEVALEHDVGDVAAQSDAVRGERAQDRLEVVDELGEGRVFERGAEVGGVEGGLDGGVAVDGEAEAEAGAGGELCIPLIATKTMNRAPGVGDCSCGRGEHVHRLGGGRLGFGFGGSGSESAASSSAIARASSEMAMARPRADAGKSLLPVPCCRFAGVGEERGELGWGGGEVELDGRCCRRRGRGTGAGW